MKKVILLVIVAMFAGCSDPLEEIDFSQKVKEHETLIERSLESIEMVLSTVNIFDGVLYYDKILDDNTIYYMNRDQKFDYSKYSISYTCIKLNAYLSNRNEYIPKQTVTTDEEKVNLYEELIVYMFYDIDNYMLVSLNRVYGQIVEKYPSMDTTKLDKRVNECKNLIESNKANYRPYKLKYTGIDPWNRSK
jgi:hypothetical protein